MVLHTQIGSTSYSCLTPAPTQTHKTAQTSNVDTFLLFFFLLCKILLSKDTLYSLLALGTPYSTSKLCLGLNSKTIQKKGQKCEGGEKWTQVYGMRAETMKQEGRACLPLFNHSFQHVH